MVEMLLTVWWMLHRGRRMVVIVRWARRVVGVLVVSLGFRSRWDVVGGCMFDASGGGRLGYNHVSGTSI